MEHDAWFFIGIFVFIFLVWIATGGPTNPISFTGPTLSQPGALGGGTYLELPKAPFSIGGGNYNLPGSSGSGGSSPFPSDIAFGNPSPYRDVVRVNHYVTGAASSEPTNEYLEISVSHNANGPVSISGWKLQSDVSGTSAIIPKGTEVPVSGTIGAAEDVVLAPGSRAYLITGRSPIGASFRENKCIGYFATYQTFYPRLPMSCPVPSDELEVKYPNSSRDPGCIDYVETIPRCQVTLTPPAGASGSCKSFVIDNLNYNGCISSHRSDKDFLGDTWRVYLGRSSSMWRTKREIVRLLDSSGKTVDAFSY